MCAAADHGNFGLRNNMVPNHSPPRLGGAREHLPGGGFLQHNPLWVDDALRNTPNGECSRTFSCSFEHSNIIIFCHEVFLLVTFWHHILGSPPPVLLAHTGVPRVAPVYASWPS